MNSQLQRRRHALSANGDCRPSRRSGITFAHPFERACLRIADQPVAIHRHGVDWAQIAEADRIRPAGGCFREADGLERALNRRQEVRASRQHLLGGTCDHLLGSATRRNQPDAHLDEAEIGFTCDLDAVGVQGDLAAAAERESAGATITGHAA